MLRKPGKVKALAVRGLRKLHRKKAPVSELGRALAKLKSKEMLARCNAVDELAKMKSPEAVKGLLVALRDADAEVRYFAANALAKMKGLAGENIIADATQGLLALVMYDKSPSVRIGAERALILFGKEAAPKLISLAKMSSEAGRVLVKIGRPAVPALTDATKSSDERTRYCAAKILGEIGAAEAVPALLGALKDISPGVRWAAAISLGQIGPKAANVQEVVEALNKLMKKDEKRIRAAAEDALRLMGQK